MVVGWKVGQMGLKPFNVIFLSMTWEAILDWDLVYFPTWFSAVFHAHVMSQPYTDSGPSSFMDQYLYAQCLQCPPLIFLLFLGSVVTELKSYLCFCSCPAPSELASWAPILCNVWASIHHNISFSSWKFLKMQVLGERNYC